MSDGTSEAFQQFLSGQYSSTVLLIVILGNICFNVLSFHGFSTFTKPLENQSSASMYLQRVFELTRLIAFGALLFVWWAKPAANQKSVRGIASSTVPFAVPFVQAIFPVLMSSVLSYQLLSEIMVTADTAMYVVPAVSMSHVGLQLYPVVVFLLLKDTYLAAIALSWAIGVITMAVISVLTQSWDQFFMLVGYVLLSGILMYDHHRNNKAVFQLVSRLQQSLEENARLEVEARAEELRAMIGNVAHDLKTPLTSFLCGIECMHSILDPWEALLSTNQEKAFLGKAKESFAAVRNCLRTMICTNTFMAMTINRCVDYTKASKGIKLVPLPGTVVLGRKLDIAVRLIRDANNDVEIVVHPIDPAICSHIITDRQWLIENLLCLFSNAVKYSNRARVEVAVHLQDCTDLEEADRMGTTQYLRFEVLDAGVGLSEEAMQTLFNPFKQAQRLAGGTGLGLFSLAKRVEALHGQYGVSKRPDGAQGSLFWFTIPYRPDEESAKMLQSAVSECAEVMDTAGVMVGREATVRLSLPEKASIPENPCPAPRPNPGLSVMIVDDAPLVVKMTTLLLHQKGHRVIGTAMNGAEALDRILGGYDEVTGTPPYDVVLMDLQMPVLDGIEATKRLRGKEQIMEAHIEDWKDQPSSMHDKEVAAGAVAGALLPPELVRASPRKLAPHSAFLRQRRRRMSYHQFVIALSANSDHETKQEAFAAGADAFLAKPFTYDAFWETVDTSKSE